MPMVKFVYDVIAFRQQVNSPIQVTFVAQAAEVLDWAGVPRKSDELLTGYQRFKDEKRIDFDVVPFFQDDRNSSPTALIVALRGDSGVGGCTLDYEDGFAPKIGEVKRARLTISIDADAASSDTIFEKALTFVERRLSSAPGEAESEGDGLEKEDVESGDSDEDLMEEAESPESEEDEQASDITGLGNVTLERMKGLLENKENWKNRSFRRSVVDFVKPAFLIDGQHRVSAAAKIGEHGLPFVVCGLFDPPWEEQVFQFTVVNLKPKRIPPALITSIAGLSLTSQERLRVEQRLSAAGVKLTEVEVMSLVAYDERSPFYNVVDMAVAGPSAKKSQLGFSGMKRIALVWWAARHSSLRQLSRSLYGAKRPQIAQWRDDRAWFEFFISFWSKIRDALPAALWSKEPGNHFFVAANLWALQRALLLQADGQMPRVWEIDDDELGFDDRLRILQGRLAEVVETTLEYLPPDLWSTPSKRWAEGDTNAGREELVKMFGRLIEDGKSGSSTKKSKKWLKDPFFK